MDLLILRRGLRRALAVAAAAVALGGAVVAGWVAHALWYAPVVTPGPPRVFTRPGHPPPVTVVLGGDTAPTDAALPDLRRHGYRFPYEPTAALLRDADVAFLNLEAPVTAVDNPPWVPKSYVYRVEPEAIPAWQWLGVDVFSLANNHIGDHGPGGVVDSVRALDAVGLAHVGAGADESAARAPALFDVGGVRVGFLAYHEGNFDYAVRYRTYAVGNRPGAARLDRADVEEDVRRLRPAVDVLVVSVHWGLNYAPVTPAQEAAARWLAELGVDVVAGHHAHDVQPLEYIGRTLVLYSLGNYAFGTPGRETLRVGLLARLLIAPGVDGMRVRGVELLPLCTQNRLVSFQPRPLQPQEMGWLDGFVAGSRARGARVQVEGTRLTVSVPQ